MYHAELKSNNYANEFTFGTNCGYRIEGNVIHLFADSIANNREIANFSGSLAIELWALKQPFNGDLFDGFAMAGGPVGVLQGQHFFPRVELSMPFSEPPAGHWHLCLMLREWTENGFITRAHVNFQVPYIVHWAPVLVSSNVINVDFAEQDKVSLKGELNKQERSDFGQPASGTGKVVGRDSSPSKDNLASKDNSPAKANAPEKDARPAEASTPAEKNTTAKLAKDKTQKVHDAQQVNLNTASAKEIAGIKGVSAKLAQHIEQARPIAGWEELLKVKGMGKKLLDKIRKQITL